MRKKGKSGGRTGMARNERIGGKGKKRVRFRVGSRRIFCKWKEKQEKEKAEEEEIKD